LKDRLKSAVVLLAAGSPSGRISVIGGVTQDLVGRVKAGELVGFVASQVGGKGGGRPDMAMGGGTDVGALPTALASVRQWVDQRPCLPWGWMPAVCCVPCLFCAPGKLWPSSKAARFSKC